MKGEERKKLLLDAGVKLAKKQDVNKLTRRAVATAADCSEALVNTYLGGLADMRSAIKKHAKKQGVELGVPKAKKQRASSVVAVKSAARAPKQPPVTA
jgi:DNA-binding transcriptional regulator YbjK